MVRRRCGQREDESSTGAAAGTTRAGTRQWAAVSSAEAISPTAHYTGYVWARNGLSHPELSTMEGRIMFDSLQPVMLASRGLGAAALESYLLARHRAIDARLERAIEAGEVGQ